MEGNDGVLEETEMGEGVLNDSSGKVESKVSRQLTRSSTCIVEPQGMTSRRTGGRLGGQEDVSEDRYCSHDSHLYSRASGDDVSEDGRTSRRTGGRLGGQVL